MAAFVAGAAVFVGCNLVEIRRQIRVCSKTVLARDGVVCIAGREVPTCPIGLAAAVIIIQRFNRSLNEKMTVVVRVRGGARWIAQLHLQIGLNQCLAAKRATTKGQNKSENGY